MKTTQIILAALLGLLLLNPIHSRAEDIDIYSGLTGTANIPNVMIIIDNASNSNAQMSACTYWDGALPTASNQGTKSLDNYMCALDSIVHSMSLRSDGSALVKLGITTQAGVYLKLTPVDDNAYTGTFPGTAGKTNRQAIAVAIRALTTVTGSAQQGSSFQETWAYYTGGNGGTTNVGENSGTTYSGTNATTGCQKNYNIFISGVTTSAHSASASSLSNLTNAVNNAVGSGTAMATTLLTQVTGVGSEKPYGIEWARFMYNVDANGSATGTQNIITYSVAAGSPVYPATMSSWEQYIYDTSHSGGGNYFAATTYEAIKNDILKILNEVQAVNSVFASSSLPVSVNAQGTFLNQIYMGMFRPDANGQPRWVGNLKQYQFFYDTGSQNLSLADSLGKPALNSGTGFISPNAVSFWTCTNPTHSSALGDPYNTLPTCSADPASGFWKNNPQGTGGAYDFQDGEMVEKGGAAQVLRLANLLNDYTTNPSSPRKVYTYCPSGTNCNAALSDSLNAFATTNGGISASMFGASNMTVSSIVRTGTTALVTTNTSHAYSTGDSVTISGATQPEYNVTQNVTVNSATTFTITGLPDYPTTPSAGAYGASLHNSSAQNISTITRSSSASSTANTETATVTTPVAHGYNFGTSVNITGATPSDYAGNKTIASVPSTTTFTFSVPVYPTTPAVNSYKAVIHPYTKTLSNVTKSGSTGKGTTSTAHGFHVGEAVTITNAGGLCNGARTVATVPTTSTFTFGCTGSGSFTAGATVVPSATPATLSSVTRTGTTVAGTATASGLTAGAFANGDQVDITTTGASSNETAYLQSAVTITCTTSPASTIGNPCTGTTFTYPITVTPAVSASGTMQVALPNTTVTIPATKITRSGTTATVTGVTNTFVSGSSLDISTSGAVFTAESAYLSPSAGWTITCSVSCSTAFTFGPVTLTPATPATGTITAYSGTAPLDKTSLINWVRGQDNLCDEASPDTGCPNQATINVRPSIHGDVLHSRPTVINYGGTIGVVVFYGANDGVYRAINGNQTNPTGSSLPIPGSELWGFIPTEFYGELTRMHDNSPLLKLPSTPTGISPTPRGKDYFVDGPSSVYQKTKADGTTDTAYLYMSMRRGGAFLYALDVSTPTNPQFKWKIINSDSDFTELGQTWSQPKVSFVKGYANPVLIFGAGYDTGEDLEPPSTGTVGRGIFIVDAFTGALVWKATYGGSSACSGTTTQASCTVSGMQYSIPSDITLMDRSGNDGYIDRLYAVDTGGNIWRVDLEPTAGNTPDKWKVTQLAALGCSSGACSAGTTPRKFFYPADMIPTPTYDAVMVGSGDREHPLYTNASYSVANRFYMVKDSNTGNNGSNLVFTENELKDITNTASAVCAGTLTSSTTLTYDNSNYGYYFTLCTGEKVVNAPLTVAGYTYFGTNTPATPTANSCTSSLGTAKGYKIKPLTGDASLVIYSGGGLPPSPIAGAVSVKVNGVDTIFPFCIGCGGDPGCVGSDCKTAIGGGKPPISVPTSRKRTYWYKERE